MAAVLLLATGACAGADPPRWIALARGAPAAGLEREGAAQGFIVGGYQVEVSAAQGGAWLAADVAGDRWSREGAGLHALRLPFRGLAVPEDGGEALRLTPDGGAGYRYVRRPRMGAELGLDPGTFTLFRGRILLGVETGDEPPERARVELYAARERAGSAVRRVPVRRVMGERYAGEGVSVWPGESVAWDIGVPPGCALRFAAAVEPAILAPGLPPVTFRVLLDGEPVDVLEVPADSPSSVWREIALAPSGKERARLRIEVEGPLVFSSVLAPAIGPAEIGSYADRPWGPDRPDLVLFLADTFRADNLSAYGAEVAVAPFLDRLAAESLCFREAWSVGTFTLPAHASMFSGVYPHQVGIVGTGRALPDELVTIAEHLAESGYRTGAVTDSVIVSQRYGLDQGFGWFEEDRHELEETLAAAASFLDADDGRPVFLFVQTYRTHAPYVASDEARRELAGRVEISGDFQELKREIQELESRGASSPEARRRGAQLTRRMRALYLGGVADLDRGFVRFHADLLERGILDAGVLIFTSDHGEAFAEHGESFHPGPVWDELIRVPLFLNGGAVEPGTTARPASLIDLPATLADLAGTPPDPRWLGRSLLAPGPGSARADTVFAFECGAPGSTLAVIEQGRKVIGYEDAEAIEAARVFAAFDLGEDPGEQSDLSDAEDWPAEILRRHGATVRSLLEPVVDIREASLDAGAIEELQDMGYGGR